MNNRKVYLGDGAYCEFDGFAFILTAENGIAAHDRITLEPEVYEKLASFVASIKAAKQMPVEVSSGY